MTWVSKKGKTSFIQCEKTKKDGQSADPITRVNHKSPTSAIKIYEESIYKIREFGHERIQKFIKIDKIKQLIKNEQMPLVWLYYLSIMFTIFLPLKPYT